MYQRQTRQEQYFAAKKGFIFRKGPTPRDTGELMPKTRFPEGFQRAGYTVEKSSVTVTKGAGAPVSIVVSPVWLARGWACLVTVSASDVSHGATRLDFTTFLDLELNHH